MSLPDDEPFDTSPIGTFRVPDDSARPYFLSDQEYGGIAIQDPSLGLEYQIWRCHKEENGDIVFTPATGDSVIFGNYPDAREISFAFDQNMNVVLAWMAGDVLYYRWYDTVAEAYSTDIIPGGRSPFVSMDDKRKWATIANKNDILLFYIKESNLCYRLQRERYVTERVLATFVGPRLWIRRCGMNKQYRIQIEILGSDAKVVS